MKRFSYKVIKTITEIPISKLNALGMRGWELCSVTCDNYGYTYYIKKETSRAEFVEENNRK